MTPLTVTQFVGLINTALASLDTVTVEGEVEEYKIIQNKWVVFDLKDATSLVRCFMPKWNLRTEIEDGMLVRAVGQVKLRSKGFLSFVLDSVQPAGEGSLKRAFVLLKKKLEHEGLFAPARKRALPRFPQTMGLITSRDAAAYGDFLKVLKARQGGLTIYFLHTPVQGEEAPTAIIRALEQANTTLKNLDAIVLVRGGGSLEDLQAFNDERVVRAVAASRVPIIVGVGHERDETLAEYAADVRASTPSNAAELLVRTRIESLAAIDHARQRLRQAVQTALTRHRTVIQRAVSRRFIVAISQKRQRLGSIRQALSHYLAETLRRKQQQTDQLLRLLRSFSPETILNRGYSITRTKKGHVLKRAAQVKRGDQLMTQLSDGQIPSVVGTKVSQLELGV